MLRYATIKKTAGNLRLFLEDLTKITNCSEISLFVNYLTEILNQHLDNLHSETINQKINILPSKGRNSRPEVFCKKGVLENITKLAGKQLCQSLFLNNFF